MGWLASRSRPAYARPLIHESHSQQFGFLDSALCVYTTVGTADGRPRFGDHFCERAAMSVKKPKISKTTALILIGLVVVVAGMGYAYWLT